MKQTEYETFLFKRHWLEQRMNAFRLTSLFADSSLSKETQDTINSIHPRLLLYGSSIAGTAFEMGDADFAVVFPSKTPIHGGEPVAVSDTAEVMASIPVSSLGYIGGLNTFARQVQPTVLTSLYEALSTQGANSVGSKDDHPHLQRIFRARIPIMQYVPSLGELQQRNKGAEGAVDQATSLPNPVEAPGGHNKREHYDISLSVDGARNSLLIRSYMSTYPSLRVACLVLKQWGRNRKILNARRGWISPYALTIMLIHYFHEAKLTNGNLIPTTSSDAILARASDAMVLNNVSPNIEGSYGIDELDTVLPMDFDNSAAFDDVSNIVKGFFEYYGGLGDFDFDCNVVDIRNEGRVTDKENWFSDDEKTQMSEAEQWHRIGYGVLMIRDPYEAHSLGRSVEFFRSESIREEMRTAAKNGVVLDTLLPV